MGQRKPQANKRKKKKRTTERRYSEGEASDYDSKSTDATPPSDEQVTEKRDSGVDLSDDTGSKTLSNGNNAKAGNRAQRKTTTTEQKNCHDLEFKNDMIFDIEM